MSNKKPKPIKRMTEEESFELRKKNREVILGYPKEKTSTPTKK